MQTAAFLSDGIITLRLISSGQLVFTCWAADCFGVDRLRDFLSRNPRVKLTQKNCDGFKLSEGARA